MLKQEIDMKKKSPITVSPNSLNCTLMIAAVAMLSACAPESGMVKKGDERDPVILAMTWMADDACKIDTITPDSQLCELTFPEFCIPQGKWVEWQSTPAKSYKIYFSPFNTGSFNAGGNGKAKGKVDNDAPYALYKYTVVADGCDPETQANDPGFRVDK
jgi:hypothetical protein